MDIYMETNELKLIRIGVESAEELWKMQVEAFSSLYEKYQDTDTSPAAEKLDKIQMRLNQPFTYFYFIVVDGEKAGAIRVIDKGKEGESKRISPIFIMEQYRNHGYAQKAIRLAERIHGTSGWELDTILQEAGNCHLYEKMGYQKTGKQQIVNDKMTLVFYRKETSMDHEIIISYSDTLNMLDEILEKRDHEWWNKFYSDRNKPVPFFKDIPDEELVSYCEEGILTGGNALDIGCGNGRNSRYLAARGFRVTGIDISEQSIRWAKDLTNEDQKINFQCASMLEYAAEADSFDFILDSGCFHHIKPHRREQYINCILRCLKDDGYFLMTCFNLDGGANISDYDVYRDYSMHGGLGFSEYKIKRILNSYFDIIDFRKMKETDNVKIFGKDFMWVILMKKRREE